MGSDPNAAIRLIGRSSSGRVLCLDFAPQEFFDLEGDPDEVLQLDTPWRLIFLEDYFKEACGTSEKWEYIRGVIAIADSCTKDRRRIMEQYAWEGSKVFSSTTCRGGVAISDFTIITLLERDGRIDHVLELRKSLSPMCALHIDSYSVMDVATESLLETRKPPARLEEPSE